MIIEFCVSNFLSIKEEFNKNESEGTIKYFFLSYPIIDALDNGKRIIVDDLDSKLHPLLVCKIITLFNSAKTNPKGAQLLFTAHDAFLLSARLFRRDQIWFTQKTASVPHLPTHLQSIRYAALLLMRRTTC